MYVKITAVPKAKKEKVTEFKAGHFEIFVKEPAERNLANTRIRQILAKWYDVGEGRVRLITGHRSPKKIFDVETD